MFDPFANSKLEREKPEYTLHYVSCRLALFKRNGHNQHYTAGAGAQIDRAMSTCLRLKFGGLVVVILGWCLLVVYLAILLDLMPRLSLLKHPLSEERVPSARTSPPRETLMREGGETRATALFTPTERVEDRGLEAVQVVMAGDTAGLGGMVAAVNSVLMHTKWPVKFYLATTDDERQHLELVSNIIDILHHGICGYP
uniref:Uncharacterized protein n=1 Tax=Timema cristinae TaxID=61476 RepID=A0A7R9D4D2_TIMCR|nr:unnamed protein product [Timema cristinae]